MQIIIQRYLLILFQIHELVFFKSQSLENGVFYYYSKTLESLWKYV